MVTGSYNFNSAWQSILLIILFILGGCVEAHDLSNPEKIITNVNRFSYVPNEVLVEFRGGVSEESIRSISDKFSIVLIEKIKGTYIYRFRLPEDITVGEAVEKLKQLNEVKKAQPNYIYRINRSEDR